jgi:hypothetical protein
MRAEGVGGAQVGRATFLMLRTQVAYREIVRIESNPQLPLVRRELDR